MKKNQHLSLLLANASFVAVACNKDNDTAVAHEACAWRTGSSVK